MKFAAKIPIKAKRIDTGDPKNVRLVIGGRLSFGNIVSPTEFEGKTFFSANILIPKAAVTKEVNAILKQAVNDAIDNGIKTKWGGNKPPRLDLPIRDGGERFATAPDTYDAYEHCYYLVAKKYSPTIGPVVMAYGKRVYDPDTVSSGDWCTFDINLYPFSKAGNKGVAVGLNGVTLIATDDRFSGAPSEESVSNAATDLYGEDMLDETGGLGGKGVEDLDIPF